MPQATAVGFAVRRLRSRAASRLMVVIGLIALLGLPAVPKANAAGGAWYDGLYQSSTIVNCGSIIFPPQYTETGITTYVGMLANPDAAEPAPSQTWYIHLVAYGMGNSCSGQWMLPAIVLPPNTSFAITPSTPMYCLYKGAADPSMPCPAAPVPSGAHAGAWTLPSADAAHAHTWGLPQGGNWEFQIPVKSTTSLTNEVWGAYVDVADGNLSPTLVPTANAYVFGSSPAIVYPNPSSTEIGRTIAKSSANLYTGGTSGEAWFDLGTTTSYGLVTDGPIWLDTSFVNYLIWDDWQPVTGPSPLQPDTVYHWRLRFRPTGSSVWTDGPDQTFRTLADAVSFSASGITSGAAGGTHSSVTVTARNTASGTATTYRGKIHFTSTDVHAILPPDYTFTAGDNGTHTFSGAVTLETAGTWEVRVRDSVSASVTGAQTGIVVTSTDNPPSVSSLGAPATPTNATTLTYALAFSEPVTGLAAADFTRTGTATGCVVGTATGSGASYAIPVTGCSAGTVVLALKPNTVIDAGRNTGPATTATAASLTIERTKPTATAPSLALRTGVAASTTAVPVTLTWSGTDTGGVGIARYELQKSVSGGAFANVSTTLTATSYATTVAPSGTVRFQVRSVDRAGNASPWMPGPTLNPRLVQETGLTYTGTWASASSASYSGGTIRNSSTAGSSASYTFTGRSIGLVMTSAASRGAVSLYLDGSTTAIGLTTYAPATTYQKLVWQQTWATTGTHTLRLVVAGTAGHPQVDLDAVAVVFADTTVPTATAPSLSPRTGAVVSGTTLPVTLAWTGTDTGGSGVARYELQKSVSGAAFATVSTTLTTPTLATTVAASGTVRFQVRSVDRAGNASPWMPGPVLTPVLVQTASGITTTGTWATQTATAYSGGSTRYASAAGATASYTFTGRAIALVTTKATSRGAVRIYLDGATTYTTVDTYATTTAYGSQVWSKTWALSGTHTVKVVVVGTVGRARVDLDAFTVVK